MKLMRTKLGLHEDPWSIQSSRIIVLTYLPMFIMAMLGGVAMIVFIAQQQRLLPFSLGMIGPVALVFLAMGIGLIVSITTVPILLICVRKKRLIWSLPIVFVPTVIAVLWYVLKPWFGNGWYPASSALVAVMVMHVMAILCCFALPDHLHSEALVNCPRCGYDLRGTRDTGCPECGWGRDA